MSKLQIEPDGGFSLSLDSKDALQLAHRIISKQPGDIIQTTPPVRSEGWQRIVKWNDRLSKIQYGIEDTFIGQPITDDHLKVLRRLFELMGVSYLIQREWDENYCAQPELRREYLYEMQKRIEFTFGAWMQQLEAAYVKD